MARGRFAVSGDLGAQDQAEMRKAFPRGFKADGPDYVNPLKGMSRVRVMRDPALKGFSEPSGPDTVGGMVGGKYQKDSHQGMSAGTKGR